MKDSTTTTGPETAQAALTEDHRRSLDEEGFIVLPGFMDADWRRDAAAAFDARLAQEGDRAGSEFQVEKGAPRLANCVTKGAVFDRAYTDPTVLAAAAHVIGRPFKLHSFNARDVLPGEGHQDLHADVERPGPDQPYSSINTLWLLDDFTEDNGATRLVPGSHKQWGQVKDHVRDLQAPHPDEVRLVAPAGTLVVFNSHLWHGGTRNVTGTRRRVLHVSYIARELPQQVSQKNLIDRETYNRLPPEVRYLLDV
jgi:ectoine hydroxylase-related dioxygenase (phytanoyl-CoA dioxygenase family)